MQEAVNSELTAFVAQAPVPRTAILAFVSEFAASLPEGARLLDAGAGNAPYRVLFDHCQYSSHDWSQSVHEASHDYWGDLSKGLSLPNGSFDAVLCTEVLEHVSDAGLVLAELHRLLAPGAKIALTVPFVGPLHEEPFDYRRLTNHGARALMEEAGFHEIDVRPLTGWFGTFAHMLLEHGLSTQAGDGRRASLIQRLVARVLRVTSRRLAAWAPSLDRRLDTRRALPIGWSIVGVA